ncbi:MAG: cob(I)yrinic acid a,c-diamide adenosyltransferase [Acidobacteriota bacterium]
MKIYTRRGDEGQTSLFSGERVKKDSPRVSAYGTLDELNSVLGVALTFCRNQKVKEILSSVQHQLFSAGADLATSTKREMDRIKETDWRHLETIIDELQKELPPLKNFILPGGSPGASCIHFSRAVCRRAERLLVNLMKVERDVNSQMLVYLNRLSDLLFVLARYENILEGGKEKIWQEEN